jgi:hypothetical protein
MIIPRIFRILMLGLPFGDQVVNDYRLAEAVMILLADLAIR